jgi:sugar phosphate isomerase/epimerase
MDADQLAVNTTSTEPTDLPAALAAYAEAGFAGVEFNAGHVRAYLDDGNTVADLRDLLDRHGLDCVGGVGGALACFGDDPVADNDGVRENAELFGALGGDVVVVGTDGPGGSPGPEVLEDYADAVGAVAETVDVTVCIEFNWGPTLRSMRAAAAVARRADADVATLFDPAHYHCTPTKFAGLTESNVATLGHVHVNDMPAIPGELARVNDDRVLPGSGALDLDALFGRIETGGYDGYVSIELFDDDIRALPEQEAARRLYESLAVLLD